MDLWWLGCMVVVAGALAAYRALRGHDRSRRIMSACHRAGLEFSPIDPFPDTLWLPFRWLGEGRWSRAENVVWNRAEGDDVGAFDLMIEHVPAGDGAPRVVHRYTCAAVALPFGCPRLEITARGGADDLLEDPGVELELDAFTGGSGCTPTTGGSPSRSATSA